MKFVMILYVSYSWIPQFVYKIDQVITDREFFRYLWCTPDTQTYTFFDFGEMSPYPAGSYNVSGALSQALALAQNELATNGDGFFNKDGLNVGWFPDLHTNVRFFVQDSRGRMTYGILGAVLTGLLVAVENFDQNNLPLVFQVNDGKWEEVGMGYVGLMTDGTVSTCTYEIDAAGPHPCSDVEARRVNI